MSAPEQHEEPTPLELRVMSEGYASYAQKTGTKDFRRRALIISIALRRYADALEGKPSE